MSPYRKAGYVNLSVRAQLTMSNVNNNCKTDNDSIAKNVKKKKSPSENFPSHAKKSLKLSALHVLQQENNSAFRQKTNTQNSFFCIKQRRRKKKKKDLKAYQTLAPGTPQFPALHCRSKSLLAAMCDHASQS